MSDATLNPSPEEKSPSTPSSGPRFNASLILMAILVVAAAVYGFHERRQANRLAAQNGQIATALNDTRGQVDALNTKLNELSTQHAPKATPAPAATLIRAHRASKRVRHEDPRWKQ